MMESSSPARWDCSSEGHDKCIALGQTFSCKMPATDWVFTVKDRASLERVIADVRKRIENVDDVSICVMMGVCPVGLFGAFEIEALRLYNVISGGSVWPWSGSYYDQPAVFARACSVIASEQAKIRSEQFNG